jgi:hypothetical protein
MLRGVEKLPAKSPADPPDGPDPRKGDERVSTDNSAITLPTQFAGSGTLDRLVETARDYARQAASKDYTVDFKL